VEKQGSFITGGRQTKEVENGRSVGEVSSEVVIDGQERLRGGRVVQKKRRNGSCHRCDLDLASVAGFIATSRERYRWVCYGCEQCVLHSIELGRERL
jgi:hypothetical protein